MPILNYTTKIDAGRTVGEIQALLASKGATNISIIYADRRPVSIEFGMEIAGTMAYYRLPSNPAGVLAAMKKDPKIPNSHCNIEQAERVTWRIVLDWVESQMALIEAGQAELAQIFLPYFVTGSGRTLYTEFVDNGLRMLKAAPDPSIETIEDIEVVR